jgi:uncharacterized membrane protein YbhN (UPF0104 family)
VQAAYPREHVRWRSCLAAYLSGVGVNAVVPARAGDLLRLFVAKRRIPGATYPTLGATLLVESIFDVVLATTLFVWAVGLGVLPGVDVFPRLPSVDWFWLLRHPRLASFVGGALAVLAAGGLLWASRRIAEFRLRVAQGVRILGTPRDYLLGVVAWQLLEWLLRLASLFFFLRAFGLDAGPTNALLVQIAQSLSTALPFTPSGIGTEQALLLYIFRGDAPTSAVLSFSVGMKVVVIAVNVAIGFAAIVVTLRTLRWQEAVARDEAAIERSRA